MPEATAPEAAPEAKQSSLMMRVSRATVIVIKKQKQILAEFLGPQTPRFSVEPIRGIATTLLFLVLEHHSDPATKKNKKKLKITSTHSSGRTFASLF